MARGQDGPDSDVDLLVDLPEQTSLFGVLALGGTLNHGHVAGAVEHDLEPLTAAVLRLQGRLPPGQ